MTSPSPRALKALRTADAGLASESLKTIVDSGAAKDPDVLIAVLDCVRANTYIQEEYLVEWIGAAAPHSLTVFNLVWPKLRRSRSAILDLFKLNSTAPRQVEQALLEELSEIGVKEGEPFRPMFLEAVAAAGSAKCLPWLEELRTAYRASLQRKSDVHIATSSLLSQTEAAAIAESLSKCEQAIAQIRGRDDGIAEPEKEGLPLLAVSRSATEHLKRAEHDAAGPYPGAALNALRMYLEATCDELISAWDVNVVTKVGRPRLSDKLNALLPKIESKDRWLFAQMCGLNKLTDFGSHHSDEFLNRLSEGEIRPILQIARSMQARLIEL